MLWKHEFEVGVAQVDDQHRGLVDAINRLHDAMKAGKGKDELARVLTFLTEYTVTHFRTEEGLMLKHGYGGYTRHHALHEDLLAQVKDLASRHAKGEGVLTLKVMDFLQNWLLKHIGEEDRRMAQHLMEKGCK